MSSQLFQEIREKNGLAYTVYSNLSSFVDCGRFFRLRRDGNETGSALSEADRRERREAQERTFERRGTAVRQRQFEGHDSSQLRQRRIADVGDREEPDVSR